MAQQRAINHSDPATKWYRQFWPWFLLALPGCVIVASLVTVAIAFIHDDSLVNDSYYRKGLAINQQLALDQSASALAISAKLLIQTDHTVELSVSGRIPPSELPPTLQLLWQHPNASSKDFHSTLVRQGKNFYATKLEHYPGGRWYITLQTVPSATRGPAWRLKDVIVLQPVSNGLDTVANKNNGVSKQAFELAAQCAGDALLGCIDEQ